jgi:eukaryotic-like serine/threonine-protein kinase
MSLQTGTVLNNRYKILEILGKGGMGAVYLALDERLGVQIALKENLVEDAEAIKQFRREAIILANLRHPNLPRVTDHFVIEGQGQYLVMDYIEGEDLRQRMRRINVLPENDVVMIGIAICDALSYLHSLNPVVIHRDIKPGNIKVTSAGKVFLVDFGLAKIVEGSEATTTGARGLTPGYSPPEQYGTARTDPRSDVYALGATLYAVVTGVPPEDGLSIAINQTSLTQIRDHRPKTNRKIASSIENALRVKMEDRFQTALQFKQSLVSTLDKTLKGSPSDKFVIEPPPLSSLLTTKKAGKDTIRAIDDQLREIGVDPLNPPTQKRKNRWPIVIFSSVLIGIFMVVGLNQLLGLNLFGGNSGELTLDEIIDVPSTVTSSPEPIATEAVIIPLVGILPTETSTVMIVLETEIPLPQATPQGGGELIAFVSNRTGQNQVWLIPIAGGNATQLTFMSDGACQPSWSPSGEWIVFTSPCHQNSNFQGAALFKIRVDGTDQNPLRDSSPTGDYDPTWSPVDENIIAFTSNRVGNRPHIFTLDLSTGIATQVTKTFAIEHQPAWSPDGERLAFLTNRVGPIQIWTMLASGEESKQFTRNEDKSYIYDLPAWSPDGKVIAFTKIQSGTNNFPFLFGAFWEDGGQNRGFIEFRFSERIEGMREMTFSPDGNWIAFRSNPETVNNDIYILHISGTQHTRLTFDEAVDSDPAWQPGK